MGELRRRLAPPTRSLLAGAHSLLALLLPATGGALLTFWPRVCGPDGMHVATACRGGHVPASYLGRRTFTCSHN